MCAIFEFPWRPLPSPGRHRALRSHQALRMVEDLPRPLNLKYCACSWHPVPCSPLPGSSSLLVIHGEGREPWPAPELGRMLTAPGPATWVDQSTNGWEPPGASEDVLFHVDTNLLSLCLRVSSPKMSTALLQEHIWEGAQALAEFAGLRLPLKTPRYGVRAHICSLPQPPGPRICCHFTFEWNTRKAMWLRRKICLLSCCFCETHLGFPQRVNILYDDGVQHQTKYRKTLRV